MAAKLQNNQRDKEFAFNMYLKRLFNTNKTTFLISWPTTLPGRDDNEVTRGHLISKLRILLYKHKYYLRPLSAKKLRTLGFNTYGPVVAISSNFTLVEFIDKFPADLFQTLLPIAVISDGTYYPSYPSIAEKLDTLKAVQLKFIPVLVKPLQRTSRLLTNIISQQSIIIKNVINLCIKQQK